LHFLFTILLLAFSPLQASESHHDHKQEAQQTTSEEASKTQSGEITWTCSMHPQIKAPEFGKCPICFMDLIPLDLTKVLPENVVELGEEQQKSAGLLTVPVQYKHDIKNLRLYGKVVLNPARVSRVTAWVAGRIDKLLVNSIGEQVKQGQALYEIYSPELIAAHQELIQASSLLQNADSKSSHYKSLQINVEAIRQKLRFLGLSESELHRLENTRELVKHVTVYAKRSGIVRNVAVNEGDYVKEGQAVLLVADMSELWVEASVYEDDIQSVQGSIQSLIILDSHPQAEISARLVRVDPFIDPKTRSSRAIFSIPNPEGKFLGGGFARVQIQTHTQAGLLVPHSAPLFIGHNAVLFLKKGNQFESQFVRILEKTESHYRVLGNLKAGDEVVARGSFKLDGEFQIQAKESMMSSEQLLSPYGSRLDLRKPIEKARDWLSMQSASSSFLEFSDSVLDLYLELQLTLGEDSFDDSKEILLEILTAIESFDKSSLSLPEQKVLKHLRLAIYPPFEKVRDSILFHDLRFAFAQLSNWIIAFVEKSWTSQGENLKKVHCPMAFEEKGAYWVQEDEDILNPYFGSKMPGCGSFLNWEE